VAVFISSWVARKKNQGQEAVHAVLAFIPYGFPPVDNDFYSVLQVSDPLVGEKE
jgi:hypothetical protein